MTGPMAVKIPKYEIVKQRLLEYISQMPADQEYLPYENELEVTFQVSKRTIRRALKDLREMGIINTVRNRGSKVLRKQQQKQQASDGKTFLKGCYVGALITSDRPGPERTEFDSWQIAGLLEKAVDRLGGRVIVYNLRERKWRDRQQVIDSLKDNGIEWTFCYYHERIRLDQLSPMLLANTIKPLIYFRDLRSVAASAFFLSAGIDWVATNHQHGLYHHLKTDFRQNDGYIYLGGKSDYSWEEARIKVVSRAAEEMNRDMHVVMDEDGILTEQAYRLESYREDLAYQLAPEVMSIAEGYQHPLIVAANDIYAKGLIRCFDEQKIRVPNGVDIIGYDNTPNALENNLSSFDIDAERICDEMVEYCRSFYRDKRASFASSTGKMVPSVLVRRMSTS